MVGVVRRLWVFSVIATTILAMLSFVSPSASASSLLSTRTPLAVIDPASGQHPADDGFVVGDLLVVLYAPSSESGKVGQFPNLVAFNDDGRLVWTAELPTRETGDCYYRVVSHEPLIANSVRSYQCIIDPQTGKLQSKEFVK